jgi:D-amino-acid dehydrogenase
VTEAIVIGGGIVGASAAYHLACGGAETLLLDRADEGRATDAGAGIVSPATSSRAGSDAWFELAAAAAAYYPELDETLREETGVETGYSPRELLSVAVDEAEVEAFERARGGVDDRSERVDGPAPGSVTELSADEARERFPPLAAPRRALLIDGAARVDGRAFADAMLAAGTEHGLAVARESATEILVDGGRTVGVATDERRYDAEVVVIAGGAWSAAFGEQLGVDVPVEPMRGQIAHLRVDGDRHGGDSTESWPIVSGFREHYLVPWPDGRVAAGATREPDAGFDPRTTAGGVREVLSEALRVAPGLAGAELAEVRVGLRPASADGLPVLGGVPGVEGAHVATGHGATGLHLGPYSGKLIAQAVRGETPETALDPFGIERFG